MKRLAFAVAVVLASWAAAQPTEPLPDNAELIAEGLTFPEGPAIGPGGDLYFTDVRGETLYKWSDGKLSTVLENTGGANGLAFHREGVLYTCQGGAQAVSRLNDAGKLEAVITEVNGNTLNQPNDLVFDANGNLYFTNPGKGKGETPASVVRLTASGDASIVATDQSYPNGIGLSPDGDWLYVNDTLGGAVTWRYPIAQDGTVGAGEKWVEFGRGAPDGMAVAESGNVYIALNISAVVAVVSPKGEILREIAFPRGSGVTNVCFGGPDRKTLYVTLGNHGKVYAVPNEESGLALYGPHAK